MRTPERLQCASSLVGTWLRGKWLLERVLGVGGTATVFAARHRNGARAAIKLLQRELADDPRLRDRFLREASIANRIEHPAVVRVLDDDDSSDDPFLVMELVEGRTLAEITEGRPLDQGVLLDVAEQLLDALSVAHAAGIVHRDIKPQNLLLTEGGRLRVLDFGIARLIDDDAVRTLFTGELWGTLEYMAPEQLSGAEPITARTDVYAVGATLFCLASNRHVHDAESTKKRVLLALTAPARSLATVDTGLHPAVVALVDRATQRRPEDRWQSAEEMLAEVRRLRSTLGAAAPLAGAMPALGPRVCVTRRFGMAAPPPRVPSPRVQTVGTMPYRVELESAAPLSEPPTPVEAEEEPTLRSGEFGAAILAVFHAPEEPSEQEHAAASVPSPRRTPGPLSWVPWAFAAAGLLGLLARAPHVLRPRASTAAAAPETTMVRPAVTAPSSPAPAVAPPITPRAAASQAPSPPSTHAAPAPPAARVGPRKKPLPPATAPWPGRFENALDVPY